MINFRLKTNKKNFSGKNMFSSFKIYPGKDKARNIPVTVARQRVSGALSICSQQEMNVQTSSSVSGRGFTTFQKEPSPRKNRQENEMELYFFADFTSVHQEEEREVFVFLKFSLPPLVRFKKNHIYKNKQNGEIMSFTV